MPYLRTVRYNGSGTILKEDICSVSPHCCVYLWTKPARLGQTPLTARSPSTIIRHRGVDRLAHDGLCLESRLKSSGKVTDRYKYSLNHWGYEMAKLLVRWTVHSDAEVNNGHAGQHNC